MFLKFYVIFFLVIPVKTGIQILVFYWIPASAGMTAYLWNATLVHNFSIAKRKNEDR